MSLNKIDTRGRSCPEPVLMTKKALLNNPKGIEVLVDNVTARENVSRFGRNAGYKVDVKEEQEDFLLTVRK